MQTFLITASTIFQIVGSCIYCVSILRGRAKPHRITRLVLLFVLILNFIGVIAAHGNTGAIIYGGVIAIFGVAFFLLSLRRGMGGTTAFDWVCFAIAMAGVVGWQATGSPILGVWLAALADLVAYLPAFTKTWKHPDTESVGLYSTAGIASILSLMAYPIGLESIFQIVGIICASGILICIYHERLLSSLRAEIPGTPTS